MPVARALRLVTVEPVLFLYMLGIFLLYGVIQALIYSRVCLEAFGDDFCNDGALYEEGNQDKLDSVQADASKWIKTSTMFMVIPSILVDCYMGSWSDRFGRRLTLVLPPSGALASTFVYAGMVAFPGSNVRWILLASFLQGAFGGFTSLLTGVLAYVAAASEQEQRTARFSALLSMSFVAGTVGPVLSGYLATRISHLLVFGLIGACHLAAIVYIGTCVNEINTVDYEDFDDPSSSPTKRWSFSGLFSLSHLVDSFRTCFVDRPAAQRKRLALLLVMALVVMVTQAGEMDIAYLYLADKPLLTDLPTFGLWFGLRYGLSSLSLLVLLPALKGAWPCFSFVSMSDSCVCAIGLASKIAGLVVLAFSTQQFMIFIEVVVGSLSSFTLTAIRAMMSQCVAENEQGKMFGLFAVFEDCSVLLGALVFNSLYPPTRAFFPGTMFLAAAAALLAVPMQGLLLLALMGKGKRRHQKGENKVDLE